MTITRVLCLSHALLVPVSLYQIWFYAHTANPYPDKLDKSDLSKKTGMNLVSRYHVLFYDTYTISRNHSPMIPIQSAGIIILYFNKMNYYILFFGITSINSL